LCTWQAIIEIPGNLSIKEIFAMRIVVMPLVLLAAVSISRPVVAQDYKIPCLIIYSKDDDVRADNKLLPYEGNGATNRRYQSQCIGLQIERGTVKVIVEATKDKDKIARIISKPFSAPKTLTKDDLPQTYDSLSFLERVGQWLGRTDRVQMGSRSGAESVSEFLVNVFSGALVIEPEGLRIPASTEHLRNIVSFRLFTGDALRAPFEGVDLSNHVISINAKGLNPGNSYRWIAQVKNDGRTEEMSGRFTVASTMVAQSVREQLRTRVGALDPSDPTYLLEAASVYSENTLKGNALILITQWYIEDQARPSSK
jgi:hypothetical protein